MILWVICQIFNIKTDVLFPESSHIPSLKWAVFLKCSCTCPFSNSGISKRRKSQFILFYFIFCFVFTSVCVFIYLFIYLFIFQLQLSAFSPHPSTPPLPVPPPSATSSLPLDFVLVSFIVQFILNWKKEQAVSSFKLNILIVCVVPAHCLQTGDKWHSPDYFSPHQEQIMPHSKKGVWFTQALDGPQCWLVGLRAASWYLYAFLFFFL